MEIYISFQLLLKGVVALSLLQIRDLTKRIGNKTIVDQVTLDMEKGEILGLLGPNGAGKTTMIRMSVGLMSKSGGQVLITL